MSKSTLLRLSNPLQRRFLTSPTFCELKKRIVSNARPYILLGRFNRPIGTALTLLPACWSINIATAELGSGLPDPMLMTTFAIGAIVMRSGGCIVNDILDRNFDSQVARTKTRPIASGIVPVNTAVAFLFVNSIAALSCLLQLNLYTQALGCSSVLMVALYPLMKRFTYFPQVWLGITFNWGILLGWSSVLESLHPAAFSLYTASIFWTLIYDTIYSHQDKIDDAKLGLKSTALFFGTDTKPFLATCAALMTFFLLLPNALLHDMGAIYNCSVLLAMSHITWQVYSVDLNIPQDCNRKFVSNFWVGTAIYLGTFGLLI